MRLHPRIFIFGGVFAVLVAIAIGVRLLWPETIAQVVRLPDGTVLQLDGVTFGKEHTISLRRNGFLDLIGLRQRRMNNPPEDRLVVWFVQPGTETSTGGSPSIGPSRKELVLFDSTGWSIGSSSQGSGKSSGSPRDFRWGFDIFPRREPKLLLRFMDKNQPVAEFSVPNPVFADYPVWKAEAYPIRKSDGDLTVTLEGFPAAYAGSNRLPTDCRVTQGGQSTTAWEPVKMTVSDATGNRLGGIVGHRPGLGKEPNFMIRGLSSHESAWKVRMEFSQTANSRFPPERLWKVQSIAVPKEDTITHSTMKASVAGAELELLGVAGTGTVSWRPNRNSSSIGIRTYVRLQVSHGHGWRVTLQVTDDKGNEVNVGSTTYRDMPDKDQCLCDFALEIPPAAQSLNLTFAIHASRFFEFLAQPPAPQ